MECSIAALPAKHAHHQPGPGPVQPVLRPRPELLVRQGATGGGPPRGGGHGHIRHLQRGVEAGTGGGS